MYTRTLPEDVRTGLLQRLTRTVNHVVARDPLKWKEYYLKPIDVVNSPDSPFAAMFAEEIGLNLDYEIRNQQEDGCWSPTWSWGDDFPDTWETAEREWKGIITFGNLRLLRAFSRLEPT